MHPDADAHPAFSRDGKKIAFQSPCDGGQPQIYVMHADGVRSEAALQTWLDFSGVPDWSPDDRQMVFQANLNPTLDPAHWQIFTMNSDGSQLKQITHDAYDDRFQSGRPTASGFCFSPTGPGTTRFTPCGPTALTGNPYLPVAVTIMPASWSHDGQRILFTSDPGHGMDIYRL